MEPEPTDRFAEALAYAATAHQGQVRKGTGVPYIAHVLAVASLVLEQGADEETAIAALLHDTAEDAGGAERLEDITARFGPRVSAIVAECSDTLIQPKPPWKPRKEAFLARIPRLSPSARLIHQADLLHNARSIAADLRIQGNALWTRFKGGRDGTLWYYREALKAHAHPSPLLDELADRIEQIEQASDEEEAEGPSVPIGG
jgi:(p)ppGpp synthase/HD superfamily hydrolase